MKPFNAELNKDVTELKALHIKKDKADFRKRSSELMQKHGVSLATLYREMKKDTPGSYTGPARSPIGRRITEKEIAMVKELMLKRIPVMDIGRIMEAETGEKYSWERIDELRKIIEVRINESGRPIDEPFVSSFGYPVTYIVEQALNLNKIAPNAYVQFTAGGINYTLNYQETRDIALICASAILRIKHGYEDELTYLNAKMKMLLREKIRTAPPSTSVKEYRNLTYQLREYAAECMQDRREMIEKEKKLKRRAQYMNRKNKSILSNSSNS